MKIEFDVTGRRSSTIGRVKLGMVGAAADVTAARSSVGTGEPLERRFCGRNDNAEDNLHRN
jgi:hypothetical protein